MKYQLTSLRIGNVLSVDGNEWTIDGLVNSENTNILYFKENPLCNYWLIADPILLTDEWIIKRGIVRAGGYPYEFLSGILEMSNNSFAYKCRELEIPLKYVHELQNLYFTLTGKELPIIIQTDTIFVKCVKRNKMGLVVGRVYEVAESESKELYVLDAGLGKTITKGIFEVINDDEE